MLLLLPFENRRTERPVWGQHGMREFQIRHGRCVVPAVEPSPDFLAFIGEPICCNVWIVHHILKIIHDNDMKPCFAFRSEPSIVVERNEGNSRFISVLSNSPEKLDIQSTMAERCYLAQMLMTASSSRASLQLQLTQLVALAAASLCLIEAVRRASCCPPEAFQHGVVPRLLPAGASHVDAIFSTQ